MGTANQPNPKESPLNRGGGAKSDVTDPTRNGGMFDDTAIDEGDDVEEPSRDLGPDRGDVERAGQDTGRGGIATD